MTADVHNKISTISIQGMVRQIGGINFVQLDCATSKKKPTLLPAAMIRFVNLLDAALHNHPTCQSFLAHMQQHAQLQHHDHCSDCTSMATGREARNERQCG